MISNNTQSFGNQLAHEIVSSSCYCITTIIAASILTIPITIIGAAFFGLTSYFLEKPVRWICDTMFDSNSSFATKTSQIVSWAISFFLTAAFASNISTLCGFSLTFKSAVILSAASFTLGYVAFVGLTVFITYVSLKNKY